MGDRLRVSVQLIDARTELTVWGERYDRELNDAFAVQSDIARQVADAMAATLSAEERGAMSRPPTSSPEAYRFYLQGRDYMLRPGYRQENFEAAEGLFRQAIDLDSDFALARASLSRVHGIMYWENFDPSPSRLEAQRAQAEEAARLEPDLPQAHVAVGWVHYVSGDFEKALAEYTLASQGLPNDAEIVARIGYTQRRLGNWPEVFAAFEKATDLSPRNANLFYDLGGHSFVSVRRYAEAVAAYDRALTLAPDLHDAAIRKGHTYLRWQGQLDTLRSVVMRFPTDLHLPEMDLARVDLALYERDADGLLAALASIPGGALETQLVYLPKSLYAGWAERLRGDDVRAEAAFDSARVVLEELAQTRPGDGRIQAALGYAYAGLGMAAQARECAERSLTPTQRGGIPFTGPQSHETVGRILAQAGLAEEAVGHLEPLLAERTHLSVNTLRLDPLYDPIRGSAAFKTLLEAFGA
jgi:serine/threonine-protein kinase